MNRFNQYSIMTEYLRYFIFICTDISKSILFQYFEFFVYFNLLWLKSSITTTFKPTTLPSREVFIFKYFNLCWIHTMMCMYPAYPASKCHQPCSCVRGDMIVSKSLFARTFSRKEDKKLQKWLSMFQNTNPMAYNNRPPKKRIPVTWPPSM